MKVLFCGDRNWTNERLIERALLRLPKDCIIIHGDAKGADTIADRIAKRLGFEIHVYPAEWKEYGRAAGLIRNQQMLDEELPDKVFAFHSDIIQSKGTKDMIERANLAKICVRLCI